MMKMNGLILIKLKIMSIHLQSKDGVKLLRNYINFIKIDLLFN